MYIVSTKMNNYNYFDNETLIMVCSVFVHYHVEWLSDK